jgi:hypothetical protein
MTKKRKSEGPGLYKLEYDKTKHSWTLGSKVVLFN